MLEKPKLQEFCQLIIELMQCLNAVLDNVGLNRVY